MPQPTDPQAAVHATFDWPQIVYLALLSRAMDELEERELVPKGLVKYQFSAKGHELGQLLLAQLMDRPMDAAAVTYRCRPFVLAAGLTPDEALAADMARAGSMSGGRDVGVVFNLPRRNGPLVLPTAGDIGSQFSPGVGWAQAIRYRAEELGQTTVADSMVVAFGGDGNVASNGFWSSLTMATTLELPVLFVIEDNGYAISVKHHLQTPGGNIAANLASFHNLAIWDGSGSRPEETAALVRDAVAHVRAGKGPGLLRLQVRRLSGHSSVDDQAYKTPEERAADRAQDPIPALRAYLVPRFMEPATWDALATQAEADLQAALEEALQQPEPDPATVTHHALYRPGQPAQVGGLLPEGIQLPPGSPEPRPQGPRLNMADAIRRTLDAELALNPRCLVFGEDVGKKGGVHTVTLGLQAKYGPGRVFDTGLSEEGIIGRAVGMALAGLTPVPEIQFRKYADPATDQLHNLGSLRWRTHNRFAAPMVVRIPGGYRKIGDPWHSVTDEVAFVHAVGWKVAVPSNAEDAVGLLRASLRGQDPVLFFEHRAMYDAPWARRPYPGDDFVLPFGQAKLVAQGADATLVTWGAMVERCLQAAAAFPGQVTVIDLRTLAPWDKETVLASVQETGKCLIVHEDIGLGGFGGEIAATIAEEAFEFLDAPVVRVTAPRVLVPFSQKLMEDVVPTVARIQAKLADLLAY